MLRTCVARYLKIRRTVWIIMYRMCTKLALRTALRRAALIAAKNVNRLESRNIRTAPGYDAGPHVLWHPTVLYYQLHTRPIFIYLFIYLFVDSPKAGV